MKVVPLTPVISFTIYNWHKVHICISHRFLLLLLLSSRVHLWCLWSWDNFLLYVSIRWASKAKINLIQFSINIKLFCFLIDTLLYAPFDLSCCICNVQFAHRKCIQRWCNKKGNITCEICNQVGISIRISALNSLCASGYFITLSWKITFP